MNIQGRIQLLMRHNLTVLPYLIKHTPKFALENIKSSKASLNVYAFDLDHTIIQPKSPGSRFSKTADDWQFLSFSADNTTLQKLIAIVLEDPYAQIVIFSNQGAVITVPPTSKSCTKYTKKIELILNEISQAANGGLLLDRLWIYAAPKRPAAFGKKNKATTTSSNRVGKLSGNPQKAIVLTTQSLIVDTEIFLKMRKPGTGMMEEFAKDIGKVYSGSKVQYLQFCGDAAGRSTDFSDSDRQFAKNLDLKFELPEHFFNQ